MIKRKGVSSIINLIGVAVLYGVIQLVLALLGNHARSI